MYIYIYIYIYIYSIYLVDLEINVKAGQDRAQDIRTVIRTGQDSQDSRARTVSTGVQRPNKDKQRISYVKSRK